MSWYVLISPSKINNIAYELVEDRTEFLEMPRNLINFLLIWNIKPSKTLNKNINTVVKNKVFQNELKYKISDGKMYNF